MVRLSAHNGKRAVKLFCKYRSNYLVRKGHVRQRQLSGGPFVHLFREAVGPANHKNDVPAATGHLFFKEGSEFKGSVLAAMLVQEYYVIRRFDGSKNLLPFLVFNLRGRHGADAFKLRNLAYGKGNIMHQAGAIKLQPFLNPWHIGLAYRKKGNLHAVNAFFANI